MWFWCVGKLFAASLQQEQKNCIELQSIYLIPIIQSCDCARWDGPKRSKHIRIYRRRAAHGETSWNTLFFFFCASCWDTLNGGESCSKWVYVHPLTLTRVGDEQCDSCPSHGRWQKNHTNRKHIRLWSHETISRTFKNIQEPYQYYR